MSDRKGSVWVIEQGEYSDYRVVGVFSSETNARLVADAINTSETYDKATVDEWVLDPAVKDLAAGRHQWLVEMLRDGTVERCEKQEVSSYRIGGEVWIWPRSTAPANQGKNIPDCLSATVWAKDEQHAIKVANEHRAQLIASGKWAV